MIFTILMDVISKGLIVVCMQTKLQDNAENLPMDMEENESQPNKSTYIVFVQQCLEITKDLADFNTTKLLAYQLLVHLYRR